MGAFWNSFRLMCFSILGMSFGFMGLSFKLDGVCGKAFEACAVRDKPLGLRLPCVSRLARRRLKALRAKRLLDPGKAAILGCVGKS